MAVNVNINGNSYPLPNTTETNWGDNVTNWMVAITQAALTVSKGTFILTAELNFGSNYGVTLKHIKSQAASALTPGANTVVQLASTDVISWATDHLSVSASKLQWKGIDLSTVSGTETLTNKTLTAPVITSPTGIVKGDVGLGNVDNTSDANKPVSTAQQAALDLKANLASPTFTGTVSGITKSMVGLGNVDNTSDATKNAAAAVLTNKDIDGGTASNTNRITVPKGSSATLSALTRKQGTVMYDTDNNRLKIDDGSVLLDIPTGTPLTNPMTTSGDIIYGGGSGAATRLPGNTTATRKFLRQLGDGTNSAAPSWEVLVAGDLPSAPTVSGVWSFSGGAKFGSGSSWAASVSGATTQVTLGASGASPQSFTKPGSGASGLLIVDNITDGTGALFFFSNNTLAELSDPNSAFGTAVVASTIQVTATAAAVTLTNHHGTAKDVKAVFVTTR